VWQDEAFNATHEDSMAMFEDRNREAREISTAIERKLLALGLDKGDQAAITELAREALDPARLNEARVKAEAGDRAALTRFELFGLAELMLKVMEESAIEDHLEVSGNEYWKVFARALYKLQYPKV
jgi:hypothetical protein